MSLADLVGSALREFKSWLLKTILSADSGDVCVHYIKRKSQCTIFATGVVRCSGGP